MVNGVQNQSIRPEAYIPGASNSHTRPMFRAFSRIGLFLDTFWSTLFPRKWNLPSVYERFRSISRYQKLNNETSSKAKKKTKISHRSVGFADWLMGLKTFSKFAPKNALKINWSRKTSWHKYMEVALSRLWAPADQTMTYPLRPGSYVVFHMWRIRADANERELNNL